MLYQCPCSTIEIPTAFFWWLTQREIEGMCMDNNNQYSKNDPFHDSLLEDGERVTTTPKYTRTRLDDIDYDEDIIEPEEDRSFDTDMSLSGYDNE